MGQILRDHEDSQCGKRRGDCLTNIHALGNYCNIDRSRDASVCEIAIGLSEQCIGLVFPTFGRA